MNHVSNFSTYRTAILQARAYRNLRNFMVKTLKNHQITSAEWSMLGIVSEETKNGGIRVSDLAHLFSVETSYITNMSKKLTAEGYFQQAFDEDDGRVRLLVGTDKCHLKVVEIERYLRGEMRQWLGDVDRSELLSYINVLEIISRKKVQ